MDGSYPTANCAISFYNIYRSTASGSAPSTGTLIAGGVTSTGYSDTGLAGSTTYYYAVEAVDADGTFDSLGASQRHHAGHSGVHCGSGGSNRPDGHGIFIQRNRLELDGGYSSGLLHYQFL